MKRNIIKVSILCLAMVLNDPASAICGETVTSECVEAPERERVSSYDETTEQECVSSYDETADPEPAYEEERVLAEASSYEEACEIADSYGAQLESYCYGVASITVSQGSCATEYFERSNSEGLPVIYPNYHYQICDAGTPDPFLSPDSKYYQWMHGEDFLNTEKAWEYSKGEGITVAVMDTGVSPMDEFGDRLLEGVNVITGTTDTTDTYGHGTHVAGILAAQDSNGEGGAGVAPAVKIYPVKCADENGGISSESIARGVNACISKNVDIINFSAGGIDYGSLETKAWKTAIDRGIVVVAAAGNTSTDAFNYPAALPGVISVAALDPDKTLASYSCYGLNLDVAAPGTAIWSTAPKNSIMYNSARANGLTNGNYISADGTSMACPTVAGTAALILSAAPHLKGKGKQTPALVMNIIKASAADETYYLESSCPGKGSIKDTSLVYGSVDAYDCVLMAKDSGKVSKPAIKVANENGKQMVTIINPIHGGGVIYYTLDGSAPGPGNGSIYTEPFELTGRGTVTIKAVAVLGKKKSQAVSCKTTVSISPVSVSVNGGKPVYIMPGKTIKLPVSIEPDYADASSLNYRVESGADFSVDEKGSVTCEASAAPGSECSIAVTSDAGAYALVRMIAKGTETNVVTVKDQLELVAVENEGTKAAGLSNLYDLSGDIRINDSNTGYELISSKPSVVKIVNNRYLKAVSKGKAVVTVVATDGSGKKSKCKVKVLMPTLSVNAIKTSTGFLRSSLVNGGKLRNLHFASDTQTEDVTEQVPIAKGGKIKLFSYLNEDMKWRGRTAPKKSTVPSNRKLVYTVSGPGSSGVSVKNGIVSCSTGATTGSKFTVTVSAEDGFGASEDITFKVYNDPGTLSFGYEDYIIKPGADFFETSFYLDGKYYEGMLDKLKVSSVGAYPYYDVSVDRNIVARGLLKAFSKTGERVNYYHYFIKNVGSTNFSYRTKDGSNRKFGFKLNIQK